MLALNAQSIPQQPETGRSACLIVLFPRLLCFQNCKFWEFCRTLGKARKMLALLLQDYHLLLEKVWNSLIAHQNQLVCRLQNVSYSGSIPHSIMKISFFFKPIQQLESFFYVTLCKGQWSHIIVYEVPISQKDKNNFCFLKYF